MDLPLHFIENNRLRYVAGNLEEFFINDDNYPQQAIRPEVIMHTKFALNEWLLINSYSVATRDMVSLDGGSFLICIVVFEIKILDIQKNVRSYSSTSVIHSFVKMSRAQFLINPLTSTTYVPFERK